jgi:hypothetical protein
MEVVDSRPVTTSLSSSSFNAFAGAVDDVDEEPKPDPDLLDEEEKANAVR